MKSRMLFFTGALAVAQAFSLSTALAVGIARPQIYVFSPTDDDPRLDEQRKQLERIAPMLLQKGVKITEIKGPLAPDLRDKYATPIGQFRFMLVGPMGQSLAYGDAPVPGEKILQELKDIKAEE